MCPQGSWVGSLVLGKETLGGGAEAVLDLEHLWTGRVEDLSSQRHLRVLSLSLADDTVGTFPTQSFNTFTLISLGCDMCVL